LTAEDDRYRRTGHGYLARAAGGLATDRPGLYAGPAGTAFAALLAARRPTDYAGLLSQLDGYVHAEADRLVAAERERIAAGRAGARLGAVDTISGLSGLGGYLLRRGHRVALAAVIDCLVGLRRPVALDGAIVPGWWAAGPPSVGGPAGGDQGYQRGHLNLGLAHGIAGPLALLALAWRAGLRRPDQDHAIAVFAGWLIEARAGAGPEPYWPSQLSLAELTKLTELTEPAEQTKPVELTKPTEPTEQTKPTEPAEQTELTGTGGSGGSGGSATSPVPDRVAWCYGTPGVARALQLAAAALDRPDWAGTAAGTLLTAADRAERTGWLTDSSLCHGWAGLLHICRLVGRDVGDPRLLAVADRIAGRLLDSYQPDSPFGFRYQAPQVGPAGDQHHGAGRARQQPQVALAPDRPGFLEGAAGIALALHGYARDAPPQTSWDTALLLN
jgi:hypothetical protein